MSVFEISGGRWRAQVRKKGVPRLDKVFATREEAEAAEAAVLQTVSSGIRLREVAGLWQQSTAWRDYAENTRLAYAKQLQPALAKLGDRGIAELEAAPMLVQLHFDERSRKYKNEKVRLEIAALGALVRWCMRRGYCKRYWLRDVERPRARVRTRRIAPTETELLYIGDDTLPPWLARHARFQFALQCLGCRAGELAAAKPEDYDSKAGTLHVAGKTGHRLLVVTNEAAYALEEQLALRERPYIWSTKKGQPYNFTGGVRLLKKHKVVAQSYHSHAARREYISRAIEAGVPLLTLRKQTGHSSVQALETYDRSAAGTPEQREQLERVQTVMERQLEVSRERLLRAMLQKPGLLPGNTV